MSDLRNKEISLRDLKIIPIAIALLSFGVRLYMNFSEELLSGNVGYYPLQVRAIIEHGSLAFPDMPLLFYLDAGVVKLISLFGLTITDDLILNTVKFMDSALFPLLLVPSYHVLKRMNRATTRWFLMAILAYLTISVVPLRMFSGFQKNGFALMLLFSSLAYFIVYTRTEQRKYLVYTAIFLLLTGATHFGTFMFASIAVSVFLLHRYRWKALLYISALALVAISLVYVFDAERGARITTFIGDTVSAKDLFHGPVILSILKFLFYVVTAFFALRLYRRHKVQFEKIDRSIIMTCVLLLCIIPLPLYNEQFASRLTNFLFVPQSVLLLYLAAFIRKRSRVTLTILLSIASFGAAALMIFEKRPPEVPAGGYAELQQLEQFINEPDRAIVVARHNLEFWVAYSMHTNVSQESQYDASLQKKYKEVLFIRQTKGTHKMPHKGGKSQKSDPFKEPTIPEEATLVGKTKHYELYKL